MTTENAKQQDDGLTATNKILELTERAEKLFLELQKDIQRENEANQNLYSPTPTATQPVPSSRVKQDEGESLSKYLNDLRVFQESLQNNNESMEKQNQNILPALKPAVDYIMTKIPGLSKEEIEQDLQARRLDEDEYAAAKQNAKVLWEAPEPTPAGRRKEEELELARNPAQQQQEARLGAGIQRISLLSDPKQQPKFLIEMQGRNNANTEKFTCTASNFVKFLINKGMNKLDDMNEKDIAKQQANEHKADNKPAGHAEKDDTNTRSKVSMIAKLVPPGGAG